MVQILKATKLSDTLHFVEMWKETKEAKEITYWNLEEMEAMNQCCPQLAREAKTLKFAVAHLLHYHIAPRRQDSAKFKWEYIDLNEGTIQFFASKNGKRCVSFIEPRFSACVQELQIMACRTRSRYDHTSSQLQMLATRERPR